MKTLLTIAAILTAATLTGIFSTSAFASDGGDESETNTQQVLKQKNVGSGESTNFNCGQNLINSQTEQECEAEEEVSDGDDRLPLLTLNPEPLTPVIPSVIG